MGTGMKGGPGEGGGCMHETRAGVGVTTGELGGRAIAGGRIDVTEGWGGHTTK